MVVTARSAHGVRTTVRELQAEMEAGISVKGANLVWLLPNDGLVHVLYILAPPGDCVLTGSNSAGQSPVARRQVTAD